MTDAQTVLVSVSFDRDRRPDPPRGRYAAPVRINGEEVQFTLVLSNLRTVDDDGWRFLADARFLVDEAPHGLLRSGASFELREGPFVPARGKVLTTARVLGPSPIVEPESGPPREENQQAA